MQKIGQKSQINRAVISLGSNINKEKNLPAAVSQLETMCVLLSVSSIYETMPVGLKEQPLFWNMAALIETELSPSQLKTEVLTKIEDKLGRLRTPDKNAPRTIDADLTLFIQEVIESEDDLAVPDPDLLRFAHVALPVAELLPDEPHPVTGEAFSQIAEDLISLLVKNQQKLPRKVQDLRIGQSKNPQRKM